MTTRFQRLPQTTGDIVISNNDAVVVGLEGLPLPDTNPDIGLSGVLYLGPSRDQWLMSDPLGDVRGPYPGLTVTGLYGTPLLLDVNQPTQNQVWTYDTNNAGYILADTNSFIGPLGGDVTGPYLSNTVGKIQHFDVNPATPLNGQTFIYDTNNSKWNPRDISAGTGITDLTGDVTASGTGSVPATVKRIQTVDVNSATPIDGQVFIYSTGNSKWNEKTISGDATLANTGALILANSGATAATYGSATKTVTATVDVKGRITSISDQTATPAESSVTFTDITTNDVSTTKHGYYPKLGTNPASISRYKYQRWFGLSSAITTVTGMGQSNPTVTSPTGASNGNNADGPGIIISTAASSGSIASIEPGTFDRVQRQNGTIYFYGKLSLPQTTSKRVWIGLSSTSVTGASGTDPLPNLHGIGFYMNPASGVSTTNWLAVSNNGSASSSISDTGVAFGTSAVTFEFTVDTSGNMTWSINGTQTNSGSTQPPGSTTPLADSVKVGASAAAQKDINFKCLEYYFAP